MRKILFKMIVFNALTIAAALSAGEAQPIKMLFVGNSFTGMHDVPLLVKQLCENGQADAKVNYLRALSGGKRLRDHWERYGNQIYLTLPERSAEQLERNCVEMSKALAEQKASDKKAGHTPYRQRIANYQEWLKWMSESEATPHLDYVVLQSHKDETGGLESLYAQYARKFAELAKKHGTRPILYVTAIDEQNAKPLTKPVDANPIMEKARYQAALANELDAKIVPVPLAVLKFQRKRPDLTLRYSTDTHLNQMCAYLTACCFYAVLFDKSPVGLTVREINSPFLRNKKDPDGNPRNVVFPDDVALALQESAWEAVNEMKALRK